MTPCSNIPKEHLTILLENLNFLLQDLAQKWGKEVTLFPFLNQCFMKYYVAWGCCTEWLNNDKYTMTLLQWCKHSPSVLVTLDWPAPLDANTTITQWLCYNGVSTHPVYWLHLTDQLLSMLTQQIIHNDFVTIISTHPVYWLHLNDQLLSILTQQLQNDFNFVTVM